MSRTFTAPLHAMDTPTARRLAGWRGVRNDLQHVLKTVERIQPLLGVEGVDNVALRAYSSSGIVGYVRCFVRGARPQLTPAIYKNFAGAEALAWHEYFMQTRHKHIAHPENVFEEVQVGCLLNQEGEVVAVASQLALRTADSPEGVRMLGELADHAMRYVMDKIQPLQRVLLSEAHAMTPSARMELPVAAFSLVEGGRPDLSAIAKQRSRERADRKKGRS